MNSFFLSQSTPHFPGLELGPGRCPAPGASGGPGGSEMELQKMLIDERMRCENHKTNYQTLKAEHTRLQDEFMRVQGELKGLLGDRQAQQEKLQLLLAELRGELLDKTRQLEESKLQVMTPQRLDLLTVQLQQEMEAPEAERYRSEYNKLRYDYTLFKSQSDYQHQELSRLEQEKKDLVAQYQGSDPSRDARRVEALLREKAQLHLRLKSLEAEVVELRALKDNSGQQAENVHRIQVRQLAESQSAIKSLEAERQSVRLQLERVENELRLAHEQNSQLTGRLHKAEREVNTLTCQVESMKHSHKLEQANVRLECSRTKGEMERERDTLQGQIDGRPRGGAPQDGRLARGKFGAGDPHLGEESARKDLHNLRTRLHQQTIRLEELERTTGELDDLKRLKGGQEVFREELRTARSQAERSQHDAERSLEEGRVQWLEEKHKKRKNQTENKENRRPAHSEEQLILNRRLKELQRRHSEFGQLLLGHQATTGAGPAFPPSSHFAAPSSHITTVNEEQRRWEVSLLHRRLEDLESVQQHQIPIPSCNRSDEMNSSFFLSQSTPHFPGLELGPGRCSTPGASGGPGGSEMELQKMLIDEGMRCENHKTNYQTLKAEHTRLQDEFMRVQGELKGLLGDRQAQQEKLQLLLAELRGELLDKTRQLEESKLQVMTPQRLDLLTVQLQQEMEAPVRERYNKLQEEAERYRSEYSKLRYDYTLFKSQSDYQHQELSRLEREKEDLVAQYQGSDPSRDARRVEALLREKAQLHLRLKSLEAEVVELRALKDNSGQQAENVHRIQVRQLAESQSAIKSLEAERQSVRLQLERVENELRLAHEQNSQLTGRLHKAEREVNTLTCQVESMKHSHKLEQANVRLECSRTKGEMERERDTLQGQIDERVTAAREEELHKTAVLHEEKLELETHMSELEQQRAQQDEAGHAHREEWEERLRGAQLGEESARKDLHNLRTRLHQQTIRLEELERTTGELDDLKRQNQELGVRLGTLAHGEDELQASNRRLKDGQEVLREELRTARSQAERSQHDAERRPAHSEEQLILNRRLKELQRRHSEFGQLLLGHQATTGAGPAFPPSSHFAAPSSHITTVDEEQHRWEVSLLHRRMEDLERVQQHQMEELGPPPEEQDLVDLCERLMPGLLQGSCTVSWSQQGQDIELNSVNISIKVEDTKAKQYYKDIQKEKSLSKPGDKTTLIAILASCGALLAMIIGLGIYATHHRKPYHENQQHLTEELHTVENGYHDNPTLEVMEVQPEMTEKKTEKMMEKKTLCSQFNDSWIVPMEIMNKLPDEEDTHL
ncbi:hypothetical protein NHX12_020507 [Muraenolepis orangiensis]|uniref:Uncharacterized protein n=1 Tax=Muraenolepis orangiensis TaxID=630683 RepID=A0A9Q0ES01_9TELE|nr:hypothetical protein NHX12_020507 [Muraenolepis orangiensis]